MDIGPGICTDYAAYERDKRRAWEALSIITRDLPFLPRIPPMEFREAPKLKPRDYRAFRKVV